MKNKHALGPSDKTSGCLSCGKQAGLGKRRYCSVACRQRLRYQLNVRTGLLKALNTRYATFYFTDHMLIMDVLPYHESRIYSFLFPRGPSKTPAQDFVQMSNMLGNAWWNEKRRTRKAYLASRHVLENAQRSNTALRTVQPMEIRIPSLKGNPKSLLYLKLNRSDLDRSELKSVIKSAFRRQARQHHPDTGGDESLFRKIYRAYEELVSWADKPTFRRRSGFPDKWFYNGENNRWVQPAPIK